jgi:hypothetical protein
MERKTLGYIVCGVGAVLFVLGIATRTHTIGMFLGWAGIALVAGWFIGLRGNKGSSEAGT